MTLGIVIANSLNRNRNSSSRQPKCLHHYEHLSEIVNLEPKSTQSKKFPACRSLTAATFSAASPSTSRVSMLRDHQYMTSAPGGGGTKKEDEARKVA